MTVEEMKKKAKMINMWLKENEEDGQWGKVLSLQGQYIKANGYKRTYISSNARKKEVENFLECLINACYDVMGSEKCFSMWKRI